MRTLRTVSVMTIEFFSDFALANSATPFYVIPSCDWCVPVRHLLT